MIKPMHPLGHAGYPCLHPKPIMRPLNGCLCQDDTCESCNRLSEAFEAMREALEGPYPDENRYAYGNRCAAALALADKVRP